MNVKMIKLLKFIKNRELEIIIAIGGIAALLSFVLENEDIFNYGIIFSSIGLISIGMRSYLRKKNKTEWK
jgi:energy-converting hydrogenase Eha subunit H